MGYHNGLGYHIGGWGFILGSRLSVVSFHITVCSLNGILCDQVFHPDVYGEGKGGGADVGTLIVSNVAKLWDFMVLQK